MFIADLKSLQYLNNCVNIENKGSVVGIKEIKFGDIIQDRKK